MRYRALALFGLLLQSAAATAAPPLLCLDSATGEKRPVKPADVTARLKNVQQTLQKRGVHVLDLADAVQDRRRRLPADLEAKDWCLVYADVVAFEGALFSARLDHGFVAAKFGRVERWLRDAPALGDHKPAAERALATAAAQLADGKLQQANVSLNKVIAVVFGSADLWLLPDKLPEPPEAEAASSSAAAVIDPSEVKEACPAVVNKATASRQDLDDAVDRLAKLVDQKAVRPFDVKGGEQLLADLASYRKLNAYLPATRVVCALLQRAKVLEIDIGSCSRRIQIVNRIRDQKGIGEPIKDQFTELVRVATDHIAKTEYAAAHSKLEELLVLLGEPRLPSAVLRVETSTSP